MSQSSELAAAWEQFTSQGSAGAYEKIYREISDALFSYGHCLTEDDDLVDDAVQEVFIDIWKRRHRLSKVEKVRPYLFQALRNKILTKLSRRNRHTRLQETVAKPALVASFEKEIIAKEEKNDRLQMLENAIRHLPKRQREILFLRYFEGYGYSEIAALLSIQPQVARNLMSRAIKRIRSHFIENAEKFWMILIFPSILSFF
jgi:RNA polymerase sigma factor (sigma-70 family)